jgi:hypothetical protein
MSEALIPNCPRIVDHFEKKQAVESVFYIRDGQSDGTPHMAPYASLILKDDCTGY